MWFPISVAKNWEGLEFTLGEWSTPTAKIINGVPIAQLSIGLFITGKDVSEFVFQPGRKYWYCISGYPEIYTFL